MLYPNAGYMFLYYTCNKGKFFIGEKAEWNIIIQFSESVHAKQIMLAREGSEKPALNIIKIWIETKKSSFGWEKNS